MMPTMKISNFKIFAMIAGVMALLFSFSAEAANDNLMSLSDQVKVASTSFYTNIQPMMYSLLWKLGVITLSVKAIGLLMKRAELMEIMMGLSRFIIWICVCFLCISQGTWLLSSIVDGAIQSASLGTGFTPDMLNPGAIMDLGIELQDKMVLDFNQRTGADSIIGAITNFLPAMELMIGCLIIMFSFAMIAINLFLAYCEMYLLIAIAPFLFAVAGLEWTKDNLYKPLQSMIALAVKIMILAIIVKLATMAIPSWSAMAANWTVTDWRPFWQVAFQILGVGVLALLAPKLASAVLAGGASMSAADALQAGGNVGSMVTGTGALAMGAAAMTGNTLASAAKSVSDTLSNSGTGTSRAMTDALSMNQNASGVLPPGGGHFNTPTSAGSGSPSSFADSIKSPSSNATGGNLGATTVPDKPTQTGNNSTGSSNTTGASIGGTQPDNAPITQQDLQNALKQQQPGLTTRAAQTASQVINTTPNEGMVSGAAVSHSNLD